MILKCFVVVGAEWKLEHPTELFMTLFLLKRFAQQDTTFSKILQLKASLYNQPMLHFRSLFVVLTQARFIRRISAMSNSIKLIKFDRNSTSESAAEFLPYVRLVLSHYPAEMWHRFKRRISAVLNTLNTFSLALSYLLLTDRHCSINSELQSTQVTREQ